MKIIFNGTEHKNRYERYIGACESENCETMSVMYLLALVCESDKMAQECFDFKNSSIKPSCLNAHWQTGGSVRAIKLAFNLWNGYNVDDCSAYKIFGTGLDKYFIEAIRLRFEQ